MGHSMCFGACESLTNLHVRLDINLVPDNDAIAALQHE